MTFLLGSTLKVSLVVVAGLAVRGRSCAVARPPRVTGSLRHRCCARWRSRSLELLRAGVGTSYCAVRRSAASGWRVRFVVPADCRRCRRTAQPAQLSRDG